MKKVWYYMNGDKTTAKIVFDKIEETVEVENYSDNLFELPFGFYKPRWENFLHLLEYRCFPKTRRNCKEILRILEIPCYNYYLIINRTRGYMENDDFWFREEGSDMTYADVKNLKYNSGRTE